MNPIAFRIPIPFLNTAIEFTWYGISIVIGVLAATVYATYAARRKGEDPNNVWDMFIFLLIFGIIGARLWYVITATLGGDPRYVQNPLEVLNIRAGGTNIFGAIMAGLLTLVVFARVRGLSFWRYADFVAPGVLLGQGLARWGNYVNQELYGPPTTLPWGIPIDAMHRIPPYNDLSQYPLSTRFHPTFLYETIYNLLAFGLIFYLLHRSNRRWKSGAALGLYLILHGIGRFLIEFFRPDQPRLAGTDISYSRILAMLFVVAGAAILYLRQRRHEPVDGVPAEAAASPTSDEPASSDAFDRGDDRDDDSQAPGSNDWVER